MVMRLCLMLAAMILAQGARAEATRFAAPGGGPGRDLVIYSTLDTRLAAPLIQEFQAARPGVSVRYEDLLSTEIARRVRAETDAGQATADFVFSSAMDMQIKLANDGYARPVAVPGAEDWPRWANWRDTAFALTFEPAVLVYHRPTFPAGPPQSRLELLQWLRAVPAGQSGRIGTYDIEQSAVGYLYLVRDAEHFADIWSLLRAMAGAGLQTFPTSQDIIDRVADGRLVLGYNILGSYAAEQVAARPDLGLVMLSDFTVVVSRVGLVPRAAADADLGAAFLEFLMGEEGQRLLSAGRQVPDLGPRLPEDTGGRLRPVAVSPGLLAYLDQAKRRGVIRKWRAALATTE